MTVREAGGAGKRSYGKPLLMVIELKAEEVLGIGCKISGGGLPSRDQPTNCGIGNSCLAHGS